MTRMHRVIGFVFVLFLLLLSLQSVEALESVPPTAPQITGSVFTRRLTRGMSGVDVSVLQVSLEIDGFYAYPQITGYFGSLTQKAVAAFQRAHGLEPIGEVGLQTRTLLNAIRSAHAPTLSNLQTASTTVASSTPLAVVASSTPAVSTSSPPWLPPAPAGSISGGGGGGGGSSGSGGGGGGGGGGVRPPPVACNLSASPSTIYFGSSSTISWSSSNAVSASLSNSGQVAVLGASIVSPSTTTAYSLTALSSFGTTATCGAVVSIIPDTVPPVVSITAPTASSTVSGSFVTVSATASDNANVVNVNFEVDGTSIGIVTTSPYSTSWDSLALPNGQHTITAIAEDPSGNYATSSIVVTSSSSPPTVATAFAPTSFWYTSIPANAPLNASSSAMDTNFVAQIAAYFGDVNINIYGYNNPIYVATSGTPTLAVTKTGSPDAGLTAQFAAVPIPYYAQPAQGADAEMVVYQPSTDKMWELYQATSTGGVWSAAWGGGMTNVSTRNGTWPYPYGTTATGLPPIAGEIKVADLQAGAINHVMSIALNDAAQGSYSWPASRTDGRGTSLAGVAIPEGARFRLDPTLNLSSYNLSQVALMVAKAAQTYGFVVNDTSGGIELSAENPLSFTLQGQPDPYPALLGSYATSTWTIFSNFPWDHLQFLPTNYGESY